MVEIHGILLARYDEATVKIHSNPLTRYNESTTDVHGLDTTTSTVDQSMEAPRD